MMHTDTVWVGGLPAELNEHDLLILFSQFGVPVAVVLARDADTGVSKRYAFVQYEDSRSAELAIDNFNGYSVVPGTVLNVRPTKYIPRKNRHPNDADVLWEEAVKRELLEKDFVR